MPWTVMAGLLKATTNTSTPSQFLGKGHVGSMDRDCKSGTPQRIGCGNVPKILQMPVGCVLYILWLLTKGMEVTPVHYVF